MTLGPLSRLRPRSRTLTVAALAGSLALTLAGCSGGPGPGEPEPGPEPGTVTRGIDAAAYVEEYEETQGDGSVNYSQSLPGDSETGGPPVPEPQVPGLLDDNTFVDAGTAGFVDPGEDAESTFALDVDTGSYGVARTLLAEGVLPPPESIRVEEWVNALPSDAAAPAAGEGDLAVTSDSGPAPSLDDGTQLVRVAVAAREVTPAERPRVNVTLVVDTSGSMDIRSRLGLVRSSLALLADRLRDDDTVSVVTFEDQARPVLEPTPVRQTQVILDAVEELAPGGSTNLEAGLALGYEQAREGYDEDAVNLVVLCSDGVANVGATGPGSISERIAEEGRDGISLVTVGYGMGNYNDHLMEQLADLGDGFYSYVDTFEEAEELFGSALTTTLTPVAAEARTQVSFDPERVAAYRLVGYDNRAIADEDFEDLDVDAGELGAGHRASALYEVRLAAGVEPGDPIGTATVRWRSPDAGPAEALTQLRAADPEAPVAPSLELAAAVADLAQLLKRAAPYDGRPVTLDDVAERVAALESVGVAGAEEVAGLVAAARRAQS
ncbi:von Willebrand factor type A domain-containing protein [Nocardioides sp. cx-173]|uniref:vWA domain-containing protein n=1 Tax=Nocardioides sp. cx-173 TaxID=2898796 RepID=UPI001E400DFE|nr:von Willebrand factor type A domain-containing protein [Nocardioides sp. cx-173]MCD4523664.1 von Willebrand factor type A domain-containing protein [Nocardioides sp. cx-173]UGB42005.1 von Willebrand factor type A domain-containing protein [Nocardioides sp. cx-173]